MEERNNSLRINMTSTFTVPEHNLVNFFLSWLSPNGFFSFEPKLLPSKISFGLKAPMIYQFDNVFDILILFTKVLFKSILMGGLGLFHLIVLGSTDVLFLMFPFACERGEWIIAVLEKFLMLGSSG